MKNAVKKKIVMQSKQIQITNKTRIKINKTKTNYFTTYFRDFFS